MAEYGGSKGQSPAETSKPVKPTGTFPNWDTHGEARRKAVENVAFGAAKSMESNPLAFRVNVDEEGKIQCPQGNPEDPSYKTGRTIAGA
jgi:hypothetical protein